MKNKFRNISILILLFLILIGETSAAIESVGFKAGLNVSNVRGDGDILFGSPANASPSFGYTFAFYVGFKLNDKYSLQPELQTSTKGFADKAADTSQLGFGVEPQTITYKYYYADFPVLLKRIYKGEGKDTQELFFGPQVSYFLFGDYRREDDIAWLTIDESEVNRWDYGLVAGWGVNYERFHFDARLYYALTDHSKDRSSKNTVISFLFGYIL